MENYKYAALLTVESYSNYVHQIMEYTEYYQDILEISYDAYVEDHKNGRGKIDVPIKLDIEVLIVRHPKTNKKILAIGSECPKWEAIMVGDKVVYIPTKDSALFKFISQQEYLNILSKKPDLAELVNAPELTNLIKFGRTCSFEYDPNEQVLIVNSPIKVNNSYLTPLDEFLNSMRNKQ